LIENQEEAQEEDEADPDADGQVIKSHH